MLKAARLPMVLGLLVAAGLVASTLGAAGLAKPKLILVVVIDQFRYDYLTRFQSEYSGGFNRLWTTGAVFTNAHLQHAPTVTAGGHATILSGATPALSGIVGNEWYDRASGRPVTSVSDAKVRLLGGLQGEGASPHRLLVSTIGDELKMSDQGASRVIGISLKDRAAILTVGRMADGAYWFDDSTGDFISSTFYFSDLPPWVKEFNAEHTVDGFAAAEWEAANGKPIKTLPGTVGPLYYDSLQRSPFGVELVLSFTKRAIEAEQLGTRNRTDLLSVSLSSSDLLGHLVGPESAEIHDLNLKTDRLLGRFFGYLDQRLGPGAVLVVFTADHGVAPLPEVQAQRKMPGGRISDDFLSQTVEAALDAKYGQEEWILLVQEGAVWLNRAAVQEKKLQEDEVEECAAGALDTVPHVYRAYTRSHLLAGQVPRDLVGLRVLNGFHPARSADVITALEPYWIFNNVPEANHGAAYSYDTHIPLIFMGAGIKAGRYDQNVALNDVAPTLATILEVETPSGSAGRVLSEMLER